MGIRIDIDPLYPRAYGSQEIIVEEKLQMLRMHRVQ
jgi:hypothetical protein